MENKKITLPDYVEQVLDTLNRRGFEAYAVGGCVRDSLLGATPKDWDVATSAAPEETAAAFFDCKLLMHGVKYGTVTALISGNAVEITTYRTDGEYTDMRRPDRVFFSRSLKDDISRRDFTINAMAYGPESGVIDFFGGRADIAAKLVRCVGDARSRFQEDALRILRALRFASALSFGIEKSTANAIRLMKKNLGGVARERVCAELTGILLGPGARNVILEYPDALRELIPGLSLKGESLERAAGAIAFAPPNIAIKLTLLLRAVETDNTAGENKNPPCGENAAVETDNTAGENKNPPCVENAAAAKKILAGLRFSNDVVSSAATITQYFDAEIQPDPVKIKLLLNKIGEERFSDLITAKKAYALTGGADGRMFWEKLDEVEKAFAGIIGRGECYTLKGLKIDGNDLAALGFPKGKGVGRALWALLVSVIEGECPNERCALIRKAGYMLGDLNS